MHAVVARPAKVQNRLVAVDRLATTVFAVAVAETTVLGSLHLHAARVQRHQLIDRTRATAANLAVGVAP